MTPMFLACARRIIVSRRIIIPFMVRGNIEGGASFRGQSLVQFPLC